MVAAVTFIALEINLVSEDDSLCRLLFTKCSDCRFSVSALNAEHFLSRLSRKLVQAQTAFLLKY